ncbi:MULTISPECIES: hypothetical protein [unclassified Anaerobiospirillum]|uniref:hypothetical protein n=1 Tax=unclassified Anaerobiospirillum TaxID=2647410 RepID=UPI001FF3CA14|nr:MULTISPECIES: hypothetical protein [unclassified Anaerobiospirillum]MCK0534553.1 hypothetical protein [Anaerobiospirillum sp. NML120511]MCK0540636.1 hypothetical protein [Anaerobiospirillum sp. NML02-A-032]
MAGAYPVTMEGICDRTDSARTASGWPVELSAFDPLMPPVKSTFYKWNPQSFHALYAPPRFAVSLKHRTEPDSSSEHTMAIPTGKRIPRSSLKKLRPNAAASRIKNAGLMACARNNDQLEPGDQLTDKLNQVSSVSCSADSHSAHPATPSIIAVDQLSAEHTSSTPELPPDNRLNITQGSSSANSTSVTPDQLMPGAAPGAGKLSVPPHAAANGADSVAQVRSSTGSAARSSAGPASECKSIADSEYDYGISHTPDSLYEGSDDTLSEGSDDTLSEGSADELYDPHADALCASCAASLSEGLHGGSGSTSDVRFMAGTAVRSGEGVRPQGTSTAYGHQDAQSCDCGAHGVQHGSADAVGVSTGSWQAAGADATAAVTGCGAGAAMALRPGMNSTADDEDILHYSMRASNSENLQVSRRGIHRYRVLSTQSMMDIINSEVMLIKRLMQTTDEENRRFIDPMVRAMVEIGSSMPNSAWYHCAMFMGIVQHSVNVALYSVSYYAWRLRASTLMAPEYASGRLRSPFVYPPARRRAIIDSKARLYASLLTRLPEEQAVEALPQLACTCSCPVPHHENGERWQDGTFIARALQAGLSAAARGLSLKQPEQAILSVISSSALSARNKARLRSQHTAGSQRHPYCAPAPVSGSGAAPFPGAASVPAAGAAPWPGSGAGPACTSHAHAAPWSPAAAGDSLAVTAGAARAGGQGRSALRQGNGAGCAPAAAAASLWAAQSRKLALNSGGHWALAAASVWSGEAADTVEVADARAFWHPLYNSALPESSYMPENIATWYGLDLFERARICELIFLTPASGEHLGLCRGPAHTRSDWASGAHSQAFTQEAQPYHEGRAPGTYARAQNRTGNGAGGPGARWPGTGITGAGGPGLTGRSEAVGMRADGSCVTSLWDLFVRQSIAQIDLDVVHHKADKRPWKVPPYNKRSKLRKGQIFMLFEARMRARGRLSERQINIALLSAVLLNGFLHDLAKVDLQVLITAENGRQYQGLTSGMTLQEFAQINGSPWLYMRRCKTARPGWRRRRRRDKTRWRPMNHCDVGHMHCIDMLKRLCPETLWLVNQAMDLYRFDRKWSGLDRITKCYDHTTDTRYARRHSKRWDYHIRTLIHEYVLMRTRALIMVSSELRRCTSAMAQLQGARADLLGRLAAASAHAAAADAAAGACSGTGAGPAAGTAAAPGCAARGPERIPGRPAMRGMLNTSGMQAMQGTEGVKATGSRAELNGHGRDSGPWEHCVHIRRELKAVERELQRWRQAMSIFERSAQVLTVNKGSSDIFIRGRNVLLRTGSAAMYSLLNTMYEFIYGPSFVSHCSECSSMKKALVEMNLQSYRLLVYSKIKRYVVAAQDEITVLQGYTISSAGLNYGHNASWYIISSRMDQYSMSDEDILQSICSKLAAYGIRRKGNIIHTPPGQAQRLLQAWRFGCDPEALVARNEATASAAAATGADSEAPPGTACPAAQAAPADHAPPADHADPDDCVADADPAVLADCAAPAQAADTAAPAQTAGRAHAENPGGAHSPVLKVSSSAAPGRLSGRDRTAAAVSTGASHFKGAVPVAAEDSDRAVRSGQAIRPHGAVQGAAGPAPAVNSSPAAPAGSSAAPAAGTARAAASATASGGELSFDDSGIPSFIDDICPDDEFDSEGLWTVVE